MLGIRYYPNHDPSMRNEMIASDLNSQALTFDLRFMLFRFLFFVPLAVVMTLIYLRTRRLFPIIIAHWTVDMIGILTGIILPMFVK